MSVLCIKNISGSIVKRYDSATSEEKYVAGQLLACWFSGDSPRLEQLIKERKQEKAEELKREALEYADDHPVFPLNWSQNKATREEMNER